MSQPKLLYHAAYFRREGAGCSQTVKPSLSASDLIGTVISVSVAKEAEEAVFEKPIGGKWVDFDARNQRDRETITVTCNELSELFWELTQAVSVTLSGGGASYVPGSTITTKGWFRIVTTDDSAATINDAYTWCKVDITTSDFPQTGFVQATFTIKKLYAHAPGAEGTPLNSGTFSNIS